ncbi:uncharacterized protein LY89DRAFT_276977 [Mollisia scopiformis]|uniref:Aminoglycoside phosphotransferase domain-containing protein n=1 Tax=Mollisia scopiformis TaxID=149040 RepID=A0A132BBI3_MOLSC|nr:uncharacterized protein LY89DRAFT_276977 [Mollisia scopiformis]KUJ09775.1 hypothetical protein LY89DRAFT_276977 [Mollisia scopiformis]
MDDDEILYINTMMHSTLWLAKCRHQIPAWVSEFHPQKLPCKLLHDTNKHDRHGSYNWLVQVVFENAEEWIVRFPKGTKVRYPDEKVEAEVSTLKLIRDKTDIPVPEVKAWGVAEDNILGLGSFIMMSVIKGTSLDSILLKSEPGARGMRQDISDEVVAIIYRQVARFMLQLFKLDFARIGSLSEPPAGTVDIGYAASVHSRPFTWRAHEMLVLCGVDTYCPKSATFSSTTDYFTHVADGDLQQLHQQRNAVDNESDARNKLICSETLKSLIPRHVFAKYDKGPFKLICDDFGPSNMIVDNDRDLNIVGVIDWEWSYAGPCQLFSSPPRWLLLQSPNEWGRDDEEVATGYEKALQVFLEVLEEEERSTLQDMPSTERLSALMRECNEDGHNWFHCIMRDGFNGPDRFVWQQLKAATPDFDQLASAVSEEMITAFIEEKMVALAAYKLESAKKRSLSELVDVPL